MLLGKENKQKHINNKNKVCFIQYEGRMDTATAKWLDCTFEIFIYNFSFSKVTSGLICIRYDSCPLV